MNKAETAWTPDHDALLDHAAQAAREFRSATAARPHRPEKDFAAMRELFAAIPLPERGREGSDVLAELVDLAEQGLSAMTGPRFFGWVIGGSHPIGVAADWLTSAWGQNCGNHLATPSAAACEETAAGWLLDILDLPRESSVGFSTGATAANFIGLAAARGRVLADHGWDVESKGLFGAPPVHVVIGDEAHISVLAGLQYLGLGRDRVVTVPTDDMGRMRIDAFAERIAGLDGPMIVVAQAGQLNTGGFDPIGEIADLAKPRGAWVHVDGAFGLWARAASETAPLADGVERADSWATDGHKWLQTPYDCGYAIVRDAEFHRRAMAATASYLPATATGERNPVDYVPELSRRARGYATWAMIRTLGRAGISDMIARHCRLARRMAAALTAESGVEILNDVSLNQLAVRFGAGRPAAEGDALTKAVIERIQAEGVCFAGGALWKGRWIMRVSVINWATSERDIDVSAAAIVEAWRGVRGRNLEPAAPVA